MRRALQLGGNDLPSTETFTYGYSVGGYFDIAQIMVYLFEFWALIMFAVPVLCWLIGNTQALLAWYAKHRRIMAGLEEEESDEEEFEGEEQFDLLGELEEILEREGVSGHNVMGASRHEAEKEEAEKLKKEQAGKKSSRRGEGERTERSVGGGSAGGRSATARGGGSRSSAYELERPATGGSGSGSRGYRDGAPSSRIK